jgi:hypothetical protein
MHVGSVLNLPSTRIKKKKKFFSKYRNIFLFCCQVFYGREGELDRIENYIKGDCEKPMVLYGEGGCGKTSLLSMAAGLTKTKWFPGVKPINIIRFLGTTPDSSALTPTLISICQQVFYSFWSTMKIGRIEIGSNVVVLNLNYNI